MLKHGLPHTASALLPFFKGVWDLESVPADWKRGIVLPLYKGKGSRAECSNYRGITLLSVPGKTFAHVLLNRMKSTILQKRIREQSGFTPGRSTTDRVLTLHLISQTKREYRQLLYAAYIDLKAAFDSVDIPGDWNSHQACSIISSPPSKHRELHQT